MLPAFTDGMLRAPACRAANPFNRWMTILLFAAASPVGRAHLIGNAEHDTTALRFAREFAPPDVSLIVATDEGGGGGVLPRAAQLFERFTPAVRVRVTDRFIFVESNGLPAHGMMIGITAWQQQVPLPQAYVGVNAWRIPLHPEPSTHPVSIKGRFLRGAIAIAANGIPIFNPQNNRGELSAEIGELDQWGGHCGRADDYHYHVAPLHLQSVLGRGLPIAIALDGYPIYGLTEPDGSAPTNLDAFDGHETAGLGYHYHASTKYPYVNGGFHGAVVELEGQVDPQPRAWSPRPAQPPLRGATITGFVVSPDQKAFSLDYTVNDRAGGKVQYAPVRDGAWKFQFASAEGTTREDIYQGDARRGPPQAEREPPPRRPTREAAPAPEIAVPRSGAMTLRSPAVGKDGVLPVEFTGDGASISPPLEWSGPPTGTNCLAVIMHHIDPEGLTKWYWTLYDIPADVHALPKDVHRIGIAGNNSIDRRSGYAPPHSKGPGAKTYVITVYALSAHPVITVPPAQTSRAVLLAAMNGLVLDSAELKVTYTRPDDRGH